MTGVQTCALPISGRLYCRNTPELLARNLKDYEEVLAGKVMTADNF